MEIAPVLIYAGISCGFMLFIGYHICTMTIKKGFHGLAFVGMVFLYYVILAWMFEYDKNIQYYSYSLYHDSIDELVTILSFDRISIYTMIIIACVEVLYSVLFGSLFIITMNVIYGWMKIPYLLGLENSMPEVYVQIMEKNIILIISLYLATKIILFSSISVAKFLKKRKKYQELSTQ